MKIEYYSTRTATNKFIINKTLLGNRVLSYSTGAFERLERHELRKVHVPFLREDDGGNTVSLPGARSVPTTPS